MSATGSPALANTLRFAVTHPDTGRPVVACGHMFGPVRTKTQAVSFMSSVSRTATETRYCGPCCVRDMRAASVLELRQTGRPFRQLDPEFATFPIYGSATLCRAEVRQRFGECLGKCRLPARLICTTSKNRLRGPMRIPQNLRDHEFDSERPAKRSRQTFLTQLAQGERLTAVHLASAGLASSTLLVDASFALRSGVLAPAAAAWRD